MRTAFLIPLAFTAAALAGCGREVSKAEREDAAASTAVPHRDLTLSMPRVPETEVASAVELAPPKPVPAPAPIPEPEHHPAVEPAGEPTAIVSEALAEPAPVDNAPSGGRELAPGRTVTIIPVATGPSVAADEGDSWLPSGPSRGVLVGGGGTCRRRPGGGGIGIAARFRVGIPAPHLR